jgi:hypothetical protein
VALFNINLDNLQEGLVIYCIANKYPQDYIAGDGLGLWETYKDNELLFGMVCLFSLFPFDYEPGFEDIPPGQKMAALDNHNYLEETLQQSIGDSKVSRLIQELPPDEFEKVFLAGSVDHLKLFNLLPENPPALKYVLKLRVLQWRHHFRGKVSAKGDIIRVMFKSNLTKEEQRVLATGISMYKSARLLNKEGEENA